MRVLIVGGGPAGLAFASLLGAKNRHHDIIVIERNARGEDPGWGVTLRADALSFLGLDMALSSQFLNGRAFIYRGTPFLSLPYPPSVSLATFARNELLQVLTKQCESVGVQMRFETDAKHFCESDFAAYDLIVVADGANSTLRRLYAEIFQPTLTAGRNQFAWLATDKAFDKLTILLEDEQLPLLAWAYRYTETMSTFIVECAEETLKDSGLSRLAHQDACNRIAGAFGRALQGGSVFCHGGIRWQTFPRLSCEKLYHRNLVLIGDAAHTTHFSQGFGTMFAFDDAITLEAALTESKSVEEALARYETTQRPKITNFQETSFASMHWAESMVDAAVIHDEQKIRELIALRWPNNEIPSTPISTYIKPSLDALQIEVGSRMLSL